MSKTKKWVVTTSGNRSLGDIKKELTNTGFKVEEVLSEIGCITGAASDSVADKLRAIPGVADVSPEPPSIDIGPPDSSLTW
jgi:hypothetical protein